MVTQSDARGLRRSKSNWINVLRQIGGNLFMSCGKTSPPAHTPPAATGQAQLFQPSSFGAEYWVPQIKHVKRAAPGLGVARPVIASCPCLLFLLCLNKGFIFSGHFTSLERPINNHRKGLDPDFPSRPPPTRITPKRGDFTHFPRPQTTKQFSPNYGTTLLRSTISSIPDELLQGDVQEKNVFQFKSSKDLELKPSTLAQCDDNIGDRCLKVPFEAQREGFNLTHTI
ncbi:hypothetical protein EVAR_6084_1 [Eumeta japonica]|uniref:Uncharacterized protein n=1 Tax=Eumeta variegata TaxID=151549 RepID=A0A4C1TGQ5_EUMVA|nr:hypothetical protein EVAR_6084_1 [Eumeta japonica]